MAPYVGIKNTFLFELYNDYYIQFDKLKQEKSKNL